MSRQEARCSWCKTTTPPLIPVGCVEQCTGAGALIHACRSCCDSRRIVPLVEHPENTDGAPRHYPPGRCGAAPHEPEHNGPSPRR